MNCGTSTSHAFREVVRDKALLRTPMLPCQPSGGHKQYHKNHSAIQPEDR